MEMNNIRFDFAGEGRVFKPMNATNGGPFHKRHAADQYRSNFEAYKAARFPYSRNHDSNACGIYGGPHSHDISAIFPNFDADENDPASYDFACTDESILVTLDAGTKTFFRLGQTIEHQVKKHHVFPPKDFAKWARVCEHIIRHYNEGWADGFTLGIEYWEIWNEPDLAEQPSDMNTTWTGTWEQYFDMYELTAKHLKKCFPSIKVGGPALGFRTEFAERFIEKMHEVNAPLDFFSWHIYATNAETILKKASRYREMLDQNGFTETESILNEYNYVAGWQTRFLSSIMTIHGMKGAAFIASCVCSAQASSVDMLMYYDTRPSAFDGCFDFYSYKPLKTYFVLYAYGMYYDGYREAPVTEIPENIYALCGVNEKGKKLCNVTYYTDEDDQPEKTVKVELGDGRYEIYLLDETHDGEKIGETTDLAITLKPNTCIQIREL